MTTTTTTTTDEDEESERAALECVRAVLGHQIRKLRLEQDFAVLDQGRQRVRGHRLGHGGDVENRVAVRCNLGLEVAVAKVGPLDDTAMVEHSEGDTDIARDSTEFLSNRSNALQPDNDVFIITLEGPGTRGY